MDKDLLTAIQENPNNWKELTKKSIIEAKKLSKNINDNSKYFGIYFEKSPSTEFKTNFRWAGFIDETIRIGFGLEFEDNMFTDDGNYYYLDDDTYIYEFAEYIKDKKIESFEDFVKSVGKFVDEYLNTSKYREFEETSGRENIYSPIIDISGEKYYTPIKKHSITDFYANGIGVCMEYTVMAQNILSTFGYETYAVLGTIESTDMDGFHAFNCIDFDDINTLIDFSYMTKRYNINGDLLPGTPYMIDLTNEETLKFQEGEKIGLEENELLFMNNKDIPIDKKYIRNYIPYKCKFYDTLEKNKIKVKYY